MPDKPATDISHGEEVTTEPQRQALEEMSRSLTEKLNAMVIEQEIRVKEFAAQHHPLSALPSLTTTPPALQPEPATAPFPAAVPPPPQANTRAEGLMGRTSSSITNGSRLPQQPPPQPQASVPPAPYKQPRILKQPKKRDESSIGAGTVATIVFIIFILMLRTCN